jgi:hypothetical protein
VDDIVQLELLMEYFRRNPRRDIPHPEVVDWATSEYLKRTGKIFRDPDRGIRTLSQRGVLMKVSKGVYRYDPDHVTHRDLEEFTQAQKDAIMKRDGHRCVVCARGKKDGVELQVDHIISKDLSGKATIENGETLCGQHNYLKKNFGQTELGKKMFIRFYELARKLGDKALEDFCTQILEVYERNGIDEHIRWAR